MVWQSLYYSGFRRIFAGMLIVVFICVNTANFTLYAFFSQALTGETESAGLQMLTRVKNATELVYNEIMSFSTQLAYNNNTIMNLMFENERDRILEYQSHQIMQSALASYLHIDYIAVYNERLDEIIATKYFVPEIEGVLKNLVHENYQQSFLNLTIPLTVRHQVTDPAQTDRNTITIILYSPLSLDGDKGALIIGINTGYFQQLIQKFDEGTLETVMIIHGNGTIITSTGDNRGLMQYSEHDWLEELLKNESDRFFQIADIEGEKTFVSASRSDILDWTFVSMIPYKKMAAKMIFLRNLTFILTLVVLCAGLLISYLIALSVHKPVRRILNRLNYIPKNDNAGADEKFIEEKIDNLSSVAEITEPLIKNAFILDMLKNRQIDAAFGSFNNRVIERVFSEPYYLVCIFSIDEQESLPEEAGETQGGSNTVKTASEMNALVKIAAELLKKASIPVDFAALSSTDLVMVLHLETGAFPGVLIPLIRETGGLAKDLSGFSVSASLGSIVDSIYAINDSFEEAMTGLKERFFHGGGTFTEGKHGKERKEIAYPRKAGEQLCQALLAGNIYDAQNAIDKFIGIIEKAAYEYARICPNTLIMETLSLCLANKLPVDAGSFHYLAEQVQKTQTLKNVRALLVNFFGNLAGMMKDNPLDSIPPLIKEAETLVALNYSDPLFSINTAAESLNITPAYFNRVFKKYRQISYSEFLNEYRIEKACKLLKTGNASVNEVSQAVGLNNTTYFYTLFKKIHNITPQQYRSNAKR